MISQQESDYSSRVECESKAPRPSSTPLWENHDLHYPHPVLVVILVLVLAVVVSFADYDTTLKTDSFQLDTDTDVSSAQPARTAAAAHYPGNRQYESVAPPAQEKGMRKKARKLKGNISNV